MSVETPGLKKLRNLTGSKPPFAWSRDGSLVVCTLRSGGLAAWNPEDGRRVWEADPEYFINGEASDVAVGTQYVAAYLGDEILLLHVESGEMFELLDMPDHIDVLSKWTQANLSWSPDCEELCIAADGRALVYNVGSSSFRAELSYPKDANGAVVVRTAWSPTGDRIAAASYHGEVWSRKGDYQGRYELGNGIYDLAFSPADGGQILVGACADRSIVVWDAQTKAQIAHLEGHNNQVRRVAFTPDGKYLLSSGHGELRIWTVQGWRPAGRVRSSLSDYISFSPHQAQVALAGVRHTVQIWSIDYDAIERAAAESQAVTYTSAKIVLVGDSGVGKTGLGWRLAHGSFKEHSSTHGQQFWLLHEVSMQRSDGAYCEAILWDLAGQPDYRLIHALFLDDADLALLVFDPTHAEGGVQGVRFWVKQLGLPTRAQGNQALGSALVAARCDRGVSHLTKEELTEYARANGMSAVFHTSAASGEGLDDLVSWIKRAIDWENRPATVTTQLFKSIKDYVLALKEGAKSSPKSIYTISEIAKMFSGGTAGRKRLSSEDFETALLHLSNHGYVSILRSSSGEKRILLVPELLNNLAASVVLEARRNPRGLGSLDEARLLSGDYKLSEVDDLREGDRDAMIDSVVSMLIQHNVCFREVDPLNRSSYIVFPELINSRKPIAAENDIIEEDVSYTISGSVENVYASLVVLMGYTSTFNRTAQWRAHARYEVGSGLVCGFRLAEDRGGEQDFVLFYGQGVGPQVKNLFKGLFESFLSRHEVVVHRYEPVLCRSGHRLNRALLRELSSKQISVAHCPFCADKINIPDSLTPTMLSAAEANVAKTQERLADIRQRFEEALFKIKSFASDMLKARPSVFISYAWGDPNHERWVEQRLAIDLVSAGVNVVLDRWENATVGASVPRFVERVGGVDKVVVVGTPLYRRKYENLEERGFVVAAEGDLIGKRMIGNEKEKSSILPVLVEAEAEAAFPNILHGRVFADFRQADRYENSFIDLAMSIYEIGGKHEVAREIRRHLNEAF